ncbi:uncharacterized protein RSE6_14889 [Rhynchosporium secalis]|uniref:Uncharacterized protein n=1 Tax=Rhynchosporium secalis TaxID=38038 RepID=A0A1E1MWE0_RHYSE|nr:uncharacterized protein RSE6_14889 [Rhynchosporium secalis]
MSNRKKRESKVVRDQAAHLKSITTKGVDIKVAGIRPLDKTEIQAAVAKNKILYKLEKLEFQIYTGNSADVPAKVPIVIKPHKAKKNERPRSSAQKNSAIASMKTSVVRRDSIPTPLIITSSSVSKKVGGRLGRYFDLEIRLKYKKAYNILGKPASIEDS